MAGNPSSPGVFYNFAAKILYFTSSIVRGSIATTARYRRGPLSFILTDSGGKNINNSFSACFILFFVVDPSCLVNDNILSNIELPQGSRYFVVCYIFISSARKSS